LTTTLDSNMATNPGRIVYCTKKIRLDDNITISATLVATSGLILNGASIQVTAVQNYPALVCFGDVEAAKDSCQGTFNGFVYISGQLTDKGKNYTTLNFNGACYMKRGFNNSKYNAAYNFTWDNARSIFWDFSVASTLQPITYLSWQEN
jgi:hypothetical protein